MAVATGVLSEAQRRTLEALCETFVPAVGDGAGDPLEASFFGRSAADLAIASQIEELMGDAMTPEEIAGVCELLDALNALDERHFASQSLDARAEMVSGTAESSFEARHGLHQLKGLTLLFFYSLPDEQGHNPNWEVLGFPGPNSAPRLPSRRPRRFAPSRFRGRARRSPPMCA